MIEGNYHKMFADKAFVIVVVLIVTSGSVTSALKSPCPDLFRYDSTDQPGQWTGTITLLSDSELHGVWVRLIFDEKLTELNVDDNFGEVVSSDNQEYLIKNRKVLLKASSPTNVQITVKYDSSKIPRLVGYRLNAKMVCPPQNSISEDFFAGDLNNKEFLSFILSNKKKSDYQEFEDCGTTPLFQKDEVKNGKAQKGHWPWQAAIYIQRNNEEEYACEATLISSRHLLTPAHCVTYSNSRLTIPVQKLTVYLGKYKQNNDGEDEQKLRVAKITLYPGYHSNHLLNDLSLIHLDKAAILNDYVRPICLRNSSDTKEGFLVGYGINRDRKIEDLAQAQVRIISEEECSKQLSDLKGLLTDNVFCAHFLQDNSVCVGDSGSTLASWRKGSKLVWELRGIVIVGTALQDKYVCNQSSGVLLLDVANYLKWIQEVIS